MSDMTEQEQKWQVERDAEILVKAEEVKADKKRLKAALALLKEQVKHRNNLIGQNSQK